MTSLGEILNVSPILTGLIGFLVGVLSLLWRYRGHHPNLCKKSLSDLEQKLVTVENQFAEEKKTNSRMETQLAVANTQLTQFQKLEPDLNEARGKIEKLVTELKLEATEKAKAEQLCQQIPQLNKQLQDKLQEIDELLQSVNHLKSSNTEIQTRMEEERRSNEEKLKLLQNAEQQLTHQFESLANRILEEKSKKFTEQNNTNLTNLVKPLREQLGEFRKRVDDVYVNDSKDRASLREELKNLRLHAEKISEDAINLTQALRGDKKAQGNWGELILERVLEQSGLRKGIEYHAQTGFRNAENKLLKPDVIIHLPEGKDVVIDSKVSLAAYETYSSATDESKQSVALKEHVEAIRNHLKGLSDKDYSNLKGLRSLDFVLMFMPIEGAFLAAFQCDEKLFTQAFERKIVVVSPTTLLATLRTIENIWRYERQNENAKLIADKAGAIYDKLRGFVEDLEKLGNQITNVQTTYDGVMNKLTRGQGNLIRQASSFVELGVKVKKQLPKSVTEQTESGSDTPSLQVVGVDQTNP